MLRSLIRDCVVSVIQEVAFANGSDAPLTGATCPATAIAGYDSPQLLHSTGEIAHRLGVSIPVKENVFYDKGRARTVDEIVARVATFTPVSSGDGLASSLPSLPLVTTDV